MTTPSRPPPRRYRFDDLVLDTGQRRLRRGDEEIQLSKLSFDFLEALVDAAPNLLTHDQLAAAVWGPRRVVTPENLSQRLIMLRKALGEQAERPRYVEAVRGQGYRLIPDVETIEPQAELEDIRVFPEASAQANLARSSRRSFRYAIAGVLAVAVTVLVIDRLSLERATTTPARLAGAAAVKPARVEIALPEGVHLAVDTEHPVLALSPDGSRLVFVGETNGLRRLYLRELAGLEVRAIPDSEGAAAPVFSPDGSRIGFVAGEFKTVAVDGGVPSIRARGTPHHRVWRGAAWTARDVIVAAPNGTNGLWAFPADGDADSDLPVEITSGTEPFGWPHALPDGAAVLFTDTSAGGGEKASVSVVSLATGAVAPLVPAATSPRYSPTGHLLYSRAGAIWAVPFDVSSRALAGPEARLVDGVMESALGAAQFDVAADGTLAYVAGSGASSASELVWVDRDGNMEPLLPGSDRPLYDPRFSPDGTRLALMSPTGANLDLWVLDLARGNTLARWTTHRGYDFGPAWSPDGRRLAFTSQIGLDSGGDGVGVASMAGPAEQPQTLRATPGYDDFVSDWSSDGEWILFSSKGDLYRLNTLTHEAEAYVETPFVEVDARLSPNGKWVAHVSARSGRPEIYVQPFLGRGDLLQVSRDGGLEPSWARDGSELFYREGDRLVAVALTEGETLTAGPPRALFEGAFPSGADGYRDYDVAPDGRRFVMVRQEKASPPTVIHVVFNWPAVLNAPSPTAAQLH